ncbi:MAG: translation elongation factor Ts [Firmicutes bacterium]|jgi:elongation factor Ts|nr:translation elongation factor Ts [Bacillota bacterium]
MMEVSLDKVRRLREETLARILDCKKALVETKGDLEEAKRILRRKGIEIARRKSGERTAQGIITSYIHHNGRVGTLVEIHCQSDFVAKNSEFQEFAKNIAMHIAASDPRWISTEEIPGKVLEEEKTILKAQAEKEGKHNKIIEKIVEGRIKKFYLEVCLLEQPFFKDEKKTVRQHLEEFIAKVGENVKIHRFVRYQLREGQNN